jgi:transposase-like protein
MERFGSDQMCHDYLVQVRWNGKPECTWCQNNDSNYFIKTRRVFKCSKCRKQFRVTQGTIFERSKIPLRTWFLAIYLFVSKKGGLSSIAMGKWIGVRQKTAWFMLQRIREALREVQDILLEGIVEADEMLIGANIRRDLRLQWHRWRHFREQSQIHGPTASEAIKQRGHKLKRGRPVGTTKEDLDRNKLHKATKGNRVGYKRGVMLQGMMERNGRAVIIPIGKGRSCLNKSIIAKNLLKHVTLNSDLMTDESGMYKDLDKVFASHKVITHEEKYVDGDIHINNIENVWHHLEYAYKGTYKHWSYHHFNRYLNEHIYRWNRRDESVQFLFETFIPMVIGKQISYERLIEEKKAA